MAYNIQGGNIFAWDLHNQGGKHEHGREVDADDGLEVVVLVVVGAEADDVEDRGREEDVGGDRDQLARQDELNLCAHHHAIFVCLELESIPATQQKQTNKHGLEASCTKEAMMNSTSTASVLSLPILTTWARVVVKSKEGF